MGKRLILIIVAAGFLIAAPLLAEEQLMSKLAFDSWLRTVTSPLEVQLNTLRSSLQQIQETAIQIRGQLITEIRLTVAQSVAVVDGKEVFLDVPPALVNGRTMVPVRFLGEAFGAAFSWDDASRKATYSLDGKVIELFIDKTTARVDGKSVTLDAAPYILQGRTMVPLRFTGQHMGASFNWDGATQTVTVIR